MRGWKCKVYQPGFESPHVFAYLQPGTLSPGDTQMEVLFFPTRLRGQDFPFPPRPRTAPSKEKQKTC